MCLPIFLTAHRIASGTFGHIIVRRDFAAILNAVLPEPTKAVVRADTRVL